MHKHLLVVHWPLTHSFTCQPVILSTQVLHIHPPSLSPTIFLCRSPWHACCSAFGDSACYRGHADECRSIRTPKLQHPSESRGCVYVCTCALCVWGICACISVGVWARCLALRLDTCGCCCHFTVPLRASALPARVCRCVCVCALACVMDLDISLWGIIWTASTAIFLYEYFTII